jgi:TRAP-type mannitol/chloroaromatic compound transport system permease large subunit
MNTFIALLVEVSLTILACVLITNYLRPFLKRVLVDLCRTEERAQFWTAFSNVLLIGLPVLISLGFRPEASDVEEAVFEILGRLSGSLAGYLFALIGVGVFVSIFALVAPRTTAEAK